MRKSIKFIGIIIVLIITVFAISCTKTGIQPTSAVDYSKINVSLKVMANPVGGAKRPYEVVIENSSSALANAQINFKQTLFYPFPPFETKNEDFIMEKDLNYGTTDLGEQSLSFQINSVEINGNSVNFKIIE
jgi:hypothetical protein